MKSITSGLQQRAERLIAVVMFVAFVVSGWKILTNETLPVNFSMTLFKESSRASLGSIENTQEANAPKKLNDASQNNTPPLERSPNGDFQFNASFVSSRPGQAVHAASIVELRDGRLRAVWFSGSREGAGDVTIQTAVMNATTLQWSDETTLVDRKQIQQGLTRYVKKVGNPVIARAPDGSLSLWLVNVSMGGWAGSSITWLRSTDDGLTWSRPRRLVTTPFLNISTLVKGPPVFYDDGSIGLPVYHEFLTKFGEILRIDAQGRIVDKIRVPDSQTSLQPVVLVKSPQQAQIYMRSGDSRALMQSSTDDAGRTWSGTQATSWPNPDSALAGLVTFSGGQWLALNPQPKDRETLALIYAGKDQPLNNAHRWNVEGSKKPAAQLAIAGYEKLLSDELKSRGANEAQVLAYVASARRQLCGPSTCAQEFSYPYLLQSKDGFIHLVYTWHRTRIKYVRFDPSQFSPEKFSGSSHAPIQ